MKSLMPPKAAGRSDIFQTVHSWPVKALLEFVPLDWTIWEPACGEGRMVETMEEEGYSVIGTDILNGFDFLEPMATVQFGYDCIITNPPYSKKDEWLTRCYETGKPFALLLPITSLGEQYRFSLYKENGIDLLLLPERVTFKTPNGTIGGGWFATAWFCHGFDLPRQITCSDIIVPTDEKEGSNPPRCELTSDMFGEVA